MNKKETNNLENQEIDLFQISKKIGSFFNGIKTWLFQAIQFFIRNRIIVSILLIIGIGLGVYLDQTQKNYEHQIIVEPNFKSTDYLYSKIDLLASKLAEGDTAFFKSIGIKLSYINSFDSILFKSIDCIIVNLLLSSILFIVQFNGMFNTSLFKSSDFESS